MPSWTRYLAWLFILVMIGFLIWPNVFSSDSSQEILFGDFLTRAENGEVESVEINNNNGKIKGKLVSG